MDVYELEVFVKIKKKSEGGSDRGGGGLGWRCQG